MPNWCDCDLTIEGPRDRLEQFLCEVVSEQSLFDFARVVPYPDQFRELDRLATEWEKKPPEERIGPPPTDGFNQGGYEWRIENWGTKWPARGVSLDRDQWPDLEGSSSRVSFHFSTAWSPPRPVVERAAECFPELKFALRYFERGCQYQGVFVCKLGVVRVDKEWFYSGDRGG